MRSPDAAVLESRLAIDPSTEMFVAPNALVLKLDSAALQVRGACAPVLVDALRHPGSWLDHVDSAAPAFGATLMARGFVQPVLQGVPARARIADALRARGARVTPVETHSFLRGDLAAIMADGPARVAIRIGAARSWLSPRFEAGCSPCWACFIARLVAQDDIARLATRGALRLMPRVGDPASVAPAVAERIADAILAEDADPALVSIDHATGACRRHPVRPCPGCVCAPARAELRAPPGGDLLARVEAAAGGVIDALSGVVAPAWPLACEAGAPMHVAVARFADPSGRLGCFAGDAAGLGASGHPSRAAFGAAATPRGAAAKALLEALERYSAIRRGDEPIVHASAEALGAAAVLCARDGDPARPRAWMPAHRLSGELCHAPAETCLAGWGGAGPDDYTSNGTAIAFTRDDAIVRGFLELVERDATTLWWYNRCARPRLDLACVADRFVARSIAYLEARGRAVTVFDITSDLGVPVVAAMARDATGAPPVFGFAARFDAGEALAGAVGELAQALHFERQEQARWGGFDWSAQPHLTADVGTRTLPHVAPPRPASIATCAAVARAAGLDLAVCDHTRRDIGLPVIRVIAPQLLPPGMPRLSARLVETPVRLGWRPGAIARHEINPQTLPM